MPIPSQPTNLIPRPFASGGTYQVIPDEPGEIAGRASFQQGFPTETQLPLSSGGIAPNRMDFQGLFHLLTAFGFWQQSGGLWAYSKTLNYAPPAVVYHKGTLWWCEKDNGPDTGEEAKEPGTDDGADYWSDFLSYLTGSSGGSSVLGNPVGTVIMYYGEIAPNGYLACDGQEFEKSQYPELAKLLGSESDDGIETDGKCKVPDLRGYFVRGYDTRNTVDPDGRTRKIGSTQEDAIRNITGSIDEAMWDTSKGNERGAFRGGWWGGATIPYKSSSGGWQKGNYYFDASSVVPTAAENRPVNVCLLYCIKHD